MRLFISDVSPGLFLERPWEPDAVYFAPGHTRFAGRELGLLSQFWLGIFNSRLSSLDNLLGHDGGVAKQRKLFV